MIEAKEDIALLVDQQINDVQAGQKQYKAIAEGLEPHPLEIAQADQPAAVDNTTVAIVQVPRPMSPPPDPDRAMRHLRLSAVVILALFLFLLWLRQRRK